MALARVRWRLRDEEFEIEDHGRLWFGESDALVGAAETAEPAGLTELNHALDRYRATMYDGDFELAVYDESEESLREEEEFLSPRPISLEFGGGHTFVVVRGAFEATARFDQGELAARLRPQLVRHRATLMPISEDVTKTANFVRLTFEISPRGRSVGDALAIGDDLNRLWQATLGGELSPGAVHDLLQAQRPALLIDQPESTWLECKGYPYRLTEPLQQLELAKDIAMLANRLEGGVLLIGPVTKTRGDRDIIKKIVPSAMSDLRPARYRGAIDRKVFPPPRDLAIEAIEIEPNEGVLFIEVPPQPQALFPFLVVGAIADGKMLGNHFSLVHRRGDRGVATKPEEVHGLLVAGRVALSKAAEHEVATPQPDETIPPSTRDPS